MSAGYLAVDLGAESGRVVLGRFDGGRVSLEEFHRFPNTPVRLPDGLHWDVLRILSEIKDGLAKAVREEEIEGIGIDSWGVDFGLLDGEGALVSNPYHHRDARTEGMMDEAFGLVGKEEIYRTTGIQFLPINTLYQLLAMRGSPLLEAAETMLLIPDLMNYWLTGEKACEYTNATTTQLLDLQDGGWSTDLLKGLDLPSRILAPIVQPATELGPLLPGVAEEVGAGPPVFAVASHDTASAVVAVPAEGEDFAYISSGTWSLVGVELPSPVTTEEGLRANFTNEGGFGGKTRLLKNVMGLWLLQECRRQWAREGYEYTYEELARLAEDAPPAGPLVDPDHPAFLAPGDMASRIRSFCEETGQRPPQEPAAVTRCVFESLALKYRYALEQAENLAGRAIGTINVVGGGSQNSLLCQLTADATRRPVLAGPVEATALGNLMVQAYARGHLASLEEMREAVRRSVKVQEYEPQGAEDERQEAYEKLRDLVGAAPRLDQEREGT
ncbi:MAG TPA: rhamnulokinase family protein [Rubrobacter sp.]|jgi:rhamnulokinase|nr:rhamnulokinase family protein [Rubrobacter sp.]